MPYTTNPDDSVRIHYEVEGTGPPLMLHVGFMGRLQDWRRVGMVDELHDEYQLILIDPRGQGRSGKPHDAASYTMQRFVGDIIAVLDENHVERAHFLGYSMGGQIGFGAGVFAPGRILSLILGGSHPYFETPESPFASTVQEEAELFGKGMDVFVDTYEKEFGPLSPEVGAQWLDNDGEALAANTLGQELFPDISEQLASITLPTLIYCGTEDRTFAKARRASESIPGATFVPLEGLDHLQTFRMSELILPQVTGFLSQVAATA